MVVARREFYRELNIKIDRREGEGFLDGIAKDRKDYRRG